MSETFGGFMENTRAMTKMREYYQEQGIITDPGKERWLYTNLPKQVDELCKIVQGLTLNHEYAEQYEVKLTYNRKKERELRTVSNMLKRIQELCSHSLNIPREVQDRLMVTSRDINVLLCSILRYQKIPSRVLCGFSAYRNDFYPSHWVCEFWMEKEERWVLADASLDPTLQRHLGIDFSPVDLPPEKFFRSEDVWTRCRDHDMDDRLFGYQLHTGLGFIRGNLLRNFASLNKYEVSPWDNWWGFRSKKDMNKDDFVQLQKIAEVTSGGSNTFQDLRSLFETDVFLSSPVRTKLDLQGEVEVPHKTENDVYCRVMEPVHQKRRHFNTSQWTTPEVTTDQIVIRGAKHHNLKDVNLNVPKNRMVVFTGVSGSGKSSLVFDTIYAEAQRRFVLGFSPYVRKYMDKVERPKVDAIDGLSPAIAIEQKTLSNNPRSTVGTITEISSYLRLLYSRVGIRKCLKCNSEIYPQSPDDIAVALCDYFSAGETFQLFAPVLINFSGELEYKLEEMKRKGVKQLRVNGKQMMLDDVVLTQTVSNWNVDVVGDCFTTPDTLVGLEKESFIGELTLSIQQILKAGKHTISAEAKECKALFTTKMICPYCHSSFPELSSQHFSFNSPLGMCPDCNGLGIQQNISVELLVDNPDVSILDGALKWFGNLREGKKTTWPTGPLDVIYAHYGLNIETPWKELPEWFHQIIFYGSGQDKIKVQSTLGMKETEKPIKGLVPELTRLYYETESEFGKKKYGAFMASQKCSSCDGTKLCKEARSVQLGGKTISEISSSSIGELLGWTKVVYEHLDEAMLEIGEELLVEIYNRLSFLMNVGLHYLSLNRTAPTLSGGEGQRVKLASHLSSGMTGVLYVLDEPSIGLHPRDINKLLHTLLNLRDQGNTVLVVEHEEEIMRKADYLIDIGPKAGILGGKVVALGTPEEVMIDPASVTGQFLSGMKKVEAPIKAQTNHNTQDWLVLEGASHNNLKDVTVQFPLGRMTCVTGVSGSGKSSLIAGTLEPLLEQKLNGSDTCPGAYRSIIGLDKVDKVINVSQSPIGRTPRSNPATYTDLFNKIRKIFANTEQAQDAQISYEYFSFNSPGGRCEACQGHGQVKIEMHFLADVWITCNDCKGRRFKPEVLDIKHNGKSIADVLEMDVKEALEFFKSNKDVIRILQTFQNVGLDYIKLGQSATTLSGGEAQRVKLAKELSKVKKGHMIYILDEPTTGLHFNDIQHLLNILHRLTTEGHTVIVIEHDLDVIKTADWIVDLGPEGGKAGGVLIAQCPPAKLIHVEESFTGQALKKMFNM
ncbi:excinuclease ABC subunit UvrA [Paenibacillus sp. 1-18]|uniref:excinuclease ABC subunit UvrA n=1 Tax=Paenibacillus sp. 1-18 TaxID=1333846 RepID=UPI0004BA9CBC|nr:excinuclease ABC subunit UvrA [Paenibacillus sp. 1-18]